MKKLKINVFLVVFLMLTVITSGVFFLYHGQLYAEQKRNVERSLSRTVFDTIFEDLLPSPQENKEKRETRGDAGDIRFIDSTVYTVILDDDQNIIRIINHSDQSVEDDEVAVIALTALRQGKSKSIGNLYFTRHAYVVNSPNYITIVDNANINSYLLKILTYSVLLFLLLEIIYVLIAKRIADAITKPVAESFDRQKQFIADASHELKTPLSVIIASADALESNPAEKKWLTNIKSESDRMSKLIADLLELAKTEEVNDKSEFAVADLSKTVEMAALTFESVMFEKGVTLKDEIEEGIELYMNVYKIKQLLSILLDNAVQHSNPGGEVGVTLKKSSREIRLSVTNRGEGIPPGDEERIFERFYRADASRNRNENRYGLGLAIAKNIAAAHDAQICAASDDGKTVFTVVFPARKN